MSKRKKSALVKSLKNQVIAPGGAGAIGLPPQPPGNLQYGGGSFYNVDENIPEKREQEDPPLGAASPSGGVKGHALTAVAENNRTL